MEDMPYLLIKIVYIEIKTNFLPKMKIFLIAYLYYTIGRVV